MRMQPTCIYIRADGCAMARRIQRLGHALCPKAAGLPQTKTSVPPQVPNRTYSRLAQLCARTHCLYHGNMNAEASPEETQRRLWVEIVLDLPA